MSEQEGFVSVWLLCVSLLGSGRTDAGQWTNKFPLLLTSCKTDQLFYENPRFAPCCLFIVLSDEMIRDILSVDLCMNLNLAFAFSRYSVYICLGLNMFKQNQHCRQGVS